MDQTKRRKAQFYRVKSKMEALEARVRELEGEAARLRRERNALLVGMMIYRDVDGSDDNLVRNLEDPKIRTAHVESAITATEASPFAEYLDLPSDLKEQS